MEDARANPKAKQGRIKDFFVKKDSGSGFQSEVQKNKDKAFFEREDEIESPTNKKARFVLSLDELDKDAINSVDNLERDPGKRKQISEFDPSERDKVRHTYLKFGPFQPTLKSYPLTRYNEKSQPRAFSINWFKNEHCDSWLEYSPHSDKAYCLYCYLFAKPNESYGEAFSSDGFNNWKSMLEKQKGIAKHIGGPSSIHNQSINAAKLLLQKNSHIVNVFENVDLDLKEVNMMRLRLLARITRHLAVQGLAFRGHDEKADSFNRGNFLELLELIKGEAPELSKQIAKSPKNALYTSSDSQKDFVKAIANLVQKYILDEIGGNDIPYTILLDEARCASRKEWMALVIRWVDYHGDIQERFLDMIHVKDTTSQTLYDSLMSLLLKHNLSPDMIRGRSRRLPAGHEPHTIEDHYRIELFNAVIDSTLSELNHRFSIDACELLSLTHYLDPIYNFESYKIHQDKILELAAKYPADFNYIDCTALKTELKEFIMMVEDKENALLFEPVKSNLKELCQVFCKNKLISIFPQMFKQIRLILTLPVSTATTERAFSAMKILKTRLRTTMSDDWLVNLMIIYIEKGIAKPLKVDDVVHSFVASSSRRLPIPK